MKLLTLGMALLLLIHADLLQAGWFDDDEEEIELSSKLAGSLLGMAMACRLPNQEAKIMLGYMDYLKKEEVKKRFSELKFNYFLRVLSTQAAIRKNTFIGTGNGARKRINNICEGEFSKKDSNDYFLCISIRRLFSCYL